VSGRVEERVDKRRTPVLNDENALKLGVFATNLRGGVTLADVPGNLRGTWPETVALARWADRLGLDAIVPIARWRGYGGDANLGDRSFETFTWATGLLAATRRIMVFATFHVPLGHPVMAAKMSATADHVSGGRFGLNIVAGWNAAELAMFGLTQREHDERYEVADEWAQALRQMWTVPGESDYRGRFFDIPGGFSEPKPLQDPYPVVMNAGTSAAGRRFAARHSDVIFAGLTNLETAAEQIREIKQLARDQHGREIRVFGRGHIVCRDTEAQARADWKLIHTERADRRAAIETTDMNMANSQSTPFDALKRERMLEGMIAGFFSVPVLGTADQVTEQLLDLHRLGLDGIALSWPDYEEGLGQLETAILPRLVQAGVRAPFAHCGPNAGADGPAAVAG
jgi:alkanesulfonate monooxygenase SsuD/methylene tetrahydromethanopterin reductase-like flavin-dependent oxidoreductase (luciferase family)